jgi:FHA domain-containing protein
MLDRIQEIDTGAIEELTRIKRDQDVLEDRLRMMSERREGVSEAVFERVRSDYRGRLDALDREAQPLKQRARGEYAKLSALRDEIRRGHDEARLEKEEVEFRNSLGEFAAEEYDQRSRECAERVTKHDGELAEVEALRERFLGSCRSPEELEAPAVEAPAVAAPTSESAAGNGAGPAAEPAATMAAPAVADAASDAAPESTPDEASKIAPSVVQEAPAPSPLYYASLDAGKTSLLDTGAHAREGAELDGQPAKDDSLSATAVDDDEWHEAPTGSFDVPPPPPPAPATDDGTEDELSGATRILARPRFIEMENGLAGREFALALGRTSIGRASDNQVHLLDEAVSRHHAEVVPGPQGYLLRDLGSENGIFVNGDRAPEHVLRDGDVVQIGARTLVFHGA